MASCLTPSGGKKAAPAAAAAGPQKIVVDPVTRIEGHLKVEVTVAGGKVVDAKTTGGMFRGFEIILKGRDPRDASQISQRICGVCPTGHCQASVLALDDAFGVTPPTNGRIIRNLILGANYVQSHILHFYHLAALDYVKGPEIAPFVPRYDGPDVYRLPKAVNDAAVKQYLKALDMRMKAQEALAIFGGRMPHVQGVVVGGTTEKPSADMIVDYVWRMKEIQKFVHETYVPTVYQVAGVYMDLFEVGTGCKNFLSTGVFPLDNEDKTHLLKRGVYTEGKDYPLDPMLIREQVKHSWFENYTNLHPFEGRTVPMYPKSGAYSFIKAPRYNGKPHEVGPLARMWITNPPVSDHAKRFLGVSTSKEVPFRALGDKAFSIMGRHAARAEECALIVDKCIEWAMQLKPGAATYKEAPIPASSKGMGLNEAPRGSVTHWIVIKDKKIDNYQVVSPTLWNAGPRDDKDIPGPIEQALIGAPVPDPKNPVNVVRVVRAFDP
ncbi:MAG: nickel-dependent hydrogenase large subunit [Deltaproteobacteria bacterium]|nr:nickel-dependent hydrogenase large subunit [Deltaproteobacteria bacterium]MBW2071016.1 nickel-dependent hydrogenase large subunit [Deltaproteobacteria bacterium]